MRDAVRMVVAWAALAGVLGGCSRDHVGDAPVRYGGSVLHVDGRDYAADTATPVPVPGRLQVRIADHRRDAALSRLHALGLSIDGDPAAGPVHVVVPAGFETQWLRALSSEPALANIALAGAGLARAHHLDAKPAPAGPPPASVVERLKREEFERIEAAGGIRITLPATGASAIVHQQLESVRSDGCTRLPPQFPDEYECSTRLKVRSCLGDCDPSQEDALDDAKRIFIAWNGERGEWTQR